MYNNYEYKAKVVRIIDGDTIDVEIYLPFFINYKLRGRLSGVDTPERGEPMRKESTAMCTELLTEAEDDNGFIRVKSHKTGKYGRWILEIQGVTDVLGEIWPYED